MATSDVINGTDMVVYVDNNGTLEAIALATSSTISVNHDPRDKTNKDSGGWSEFLEGLRDWTISTDALVAFDQGQNIDELYDLLLNRSVVDVKFSTENTGDKYFSGKALISSIEQESPNEDNVTMSVELQGTGKLDKLDVT